MSSDGNPSYLTVRETALRLGVHENTVRNWARSGTLPTSRLPGTKFHRFDERDVERLRAQRGQRVPSIAVERRTIGPELVDASQLHQWATTREAQDVFPEAVRRLLAATPGVTSISMRAGDGVALEGWDGEAASVGTKFLPEGKLRFELGVGRNLSAKASSDYANRKDSAEASDTTFVFATPRRWAPGKQWAEERRRERAFRDVRVLDADDFEGWLQATPVVHHWLSERLGRRPKHAETLERWWSRFQARTLPPLPRELFLAGRQAAQAKLGEFLGQPAGVLTVRAPWLDEAIAFVCATIESFATTEALQPAMLISSPDVWDRVVQQPGRMTLLPLFDDPDIAVAQRLGHHVVIPLGQAASSRTVDIDLPRPHRQIADEALEAAGINSDTAYRLSALARRSMPSLVRTLSRDPRISRPRWSEPPASSVFAPLVLLGGWTATPDDQAVASIVADKSWEEIERLLRYWAATEDPPFVMSSSQWHVASAEEAFLVVRHLLTRGDLERWHDIAIDVLLEPDPRLDLDPDDRPMAGINGIKRDFSHVLRRGVAEGVALLGSSGQERLANDRSGAEVASNIVRRVLAAAHADDSGQTWRSLDDVLPLLAEAAPVAFLDAVHDDLDRDQPLLGSMFQDTDQSSWMHSSSPHTGLLWALEALCWPAETFLDATRALARLHLIDPGGRLSNRPLESLRNVFVTWVRQTAAPPDLRIRGLNSICRRMPDTGWALLLGVWPENQSVTSPPHSPRFRDWKPDDQNVPIVEWLDYVANTVDLAIELAARRPELWSELAGQIAPLPPSARAKLLSFLEAEAVPDALSSEQRLMVWERIQTEAARHRRFASSEWAMHSESLERLEALAARLEPTSDIERFAYLFDWRPDLPDLPLHDHSAYDAKLLQLRAAALETALSDGGVEAVRRLALRAPVPSHIGWTLGALTEDGHGQLLLEWLDSDEEPLRETAAHWAARKQRDLGVTWTRDVLGLPSVATLERRQNLVLQAEPTRELWDLLDTMDAALVDAYWSRMRAFAVAPVDAEFAARRLLEYERPWEAIDMLAASEHRTTEQASEVTSDLVQDVLDAALLADPAVGRSSVSGYELGLLLDHLEDCGSPSATVARYEFAFFRLLEHHREPRALYAALGADPLLFVDLVSRVYRGKSDVKRNLDETSAGMARHAWWVLHHWAGVPGLRDDGTLDATRLSAWVREARLAFAEVDRSDIGDEEIGRVLSASPPDADGTWPPPPVREIIETIGSTFLENGLHVGRINARGTTSRGVYDGGQQERALADDYRQWSRAAEGDWPRTSRVLRRLAEDYERDAHRMDDEAEITADTE